MGCQQELLLKDAGFHTTAQNKSAFEKTGFITKQIVKDHYLSKESRILFKQII
jgi:hypothetical protein